MNLETQGEDLLTAREMSDLTEAIGVDEEYFGSQDVKRCVLLAKDGLKYREKQIDTIKKGINKLLKEV